MYEYSMRIFRVLQYKSVTLKDLKVFSQSEAVSDPETDLKNAYEQSSEFNGYRFKEKK